VTSNVALRFLKQCVNFTCLHFLNTEPLWLFIYLWQTSPTKRNFWYRKNFLQPLTIFNLKFNSLTQQNLSVPWINMIEQHSKFLFDPGEYVTRCLICYCQFILVIIANLYYISLAKLHAACMFVFCGFLRDRFWFRFIKIFNKSLLSFPDFVILSRS